MAKKFSYGPVAVLVGGTIGAGIFSLPYVLIHSGIFYFSAFFALIFLLVLAINLILAEISLNIKGSHRTPGYIYLILGEKFRLFALISAFSGGIGGLLAYIILGATFLKIILLGVLGENLAVYAFVFYILHLLDVFKGLKTIEKIDRVSSTLLIGAIAVLALFMAGHLRAENLSWFTEGNVVLPYGVLLFAFWGANMIPGIAELTGKKPRELKSVIISGMAAIGLVYLIFAFTVAAAAGSGTAQDSLTGLSTIVGPMAVYLAALVGLLAVGNGFDAVGVNVADAVRLDFKAPWLKWPIFIIPLVIYFLGVQDLIKIIGFSGAVFLAFDGLLIILMHRKYSPKIKIRIFPRVNNFVYFFLAAVFIAGIGTTIYLSLVK